MNSNLDQFKSFSPKEEDFAVVTNDVVIYTRVSSSDQEDNTSLESQKRNCDELAINRGYKVREYFGGTFESAKSDDRVEFERMLAYVKANKNISYIIVYSYDRFSRTGISGAYIADSLMKDFNVQVVSVSQLVNPKTAEGRMVQNINFVFSNYENEQRKHKCESGTKEVLKKGYWPFSLPFGYTNLNPRTRAHQHEIVLNDKAPLVKLMFEWKLQGIPSIEIQARLKKKGVNIIDKTISKMFRNPFYCGIVVSRFLPNQVIEGNHPAIISQDLFLQVNGLLNVRNTRRNHNLDEDENLPLRRFAKCESCEKPLTGYKVKSKGLYYYKCRTKGCGCNKSTKKMHDQFVHLLSHFELQDQFVPVFETSCVMKKKIEERESYAKTDDVRVTKQLKSLQTKLDKVEERFVLNEIPVELYKKYSDQYREEMDVLSKLLSKGVQESSNLEKAIEKTVSLSLHLQQSWAIGNYGEKSRLQKIIFPEGISYDRKTDTVRTPRINSFFAPILSISKGVEVDGQNEVSHFVHHLPQVESEGFEPSSKQAIISPSTCLFCG